MLLHRIHIDPRCREARRDLSDPYQMHSTLCRAFCDVNERCPKGEFLWRLEPESDSAGYPRVLMQSRTIPRWERIGVKGWLANADPPIDLKKRLQLDLLTVGQRFRFRVRANPCVTRNGRRLGLFQRGEQESWIWKKGERHGFSLLRFTPESTQGQVDVRISQEQMLFGKKHDGNNIRIYSVLYDGILTIADTDKFRDVLQTGIGHGKALGLGLLSVSPIA